MVEIAHLTFDPDALGVSKGHLIVPKGVDSEALSLPAFCCNKGDGPKLLITGGNHGDEPQGPIIARRLIEWLPAEQTCGSVIVVPEINPSAVKAFTRNNPVDRKNLNRVFPGRGDGSASERIADAISSVFLPRTETVIDLHSFGILWDCAPSVIMHPVSDADLMDKMIRLGEAFRLPVTLVWQHPDTDGMFDTLAQNRGKVLVCTELGGGTAKNEDLAIYELGVRNALIGLGLIEGEVEQPVFQQRKSSRTLETLLADELCSPTQGIFEPSCSILDEVKKGDLLGVVHCMSSLSAPIKILAPSTSVIYAIRSGGHVEADEAVVQLARPITRK